MHDEGKDAPVLDEGAGDAVFELRAGWGTATEAGLVLLEELPALSESYPDGLDSARIGLRWEQVGAAAPSDGEVLGRFAPVRAGFPGQQADLSAARGALIVISENADPTAATAFDEWYDGTHLPDVVRAGGYYSAARYRGVEINPERGDRRALVGKSFALYLTSEEPLAAHRRVQAAFADMVMWPSIDVHHVRDYRIASE